MINSIKWAPQSFAAWPKLAKVWILKRNSAIWLQFIIELCACTSRCGVYMCVYIYIYIYICTTIPNSFPKNQKEHMPLQISAKIWTELQCQVPTRWGSSKSSALTKGFVSTATATYLRAPFRRSEKFRQGIFHFSQEKTRSKGLRLKMTFWKRVRAHCH